ncbi:MAG TPA: aconitate hydratase AcnA [Alphaproteobacteria bacterium]|nr:aconitate hydratase AcnA [Alphaproteobacteria bacterium]
MGLRNTIEAAGRSYDYFRLKDLEAKGHDLARMPKSLKVLLENLARFEDGKTVTTSDIDTLAGWVNNRATNQEIAYRPARVLMQDFTGVPAVVDLAAMRDAVSKQGADPEKINPLAPVDLVIDHSVMVDYFASHDAMTRNEDVEYERNGERYSFLRWGQKAFDNFRVVPPGTGICHQVNLEYLAQTVWTRDENGREVAYPDTLVGTDSHTTMVNGLGVLGWGVGGIEAEAPMLGQPVSMLVPDVIGVRLTGKINEGVTATDLVLTITQMLRSYGVVGKFVEFFGPGLDNMSLEDRATIANMAPEYGATCGFFPIDAETINYLRKSGREEARIALVEAYAKEQGLWNDTSVEPVFTDVLELDMTSVVASLAGPKRPQDRVNLQDAGHAFGESLSSEFKRDDKPQVQIPGQDATISHGAVVIAAITSCTNTSNPSVLIAAGLVARKARALGLDVKPWVKTSLAPGSQVVTGYLTSSGLQEDLDGLGFQTVGYGCTTCIGNSGPLPEDVAEAVTKGDLVACSVLSGNRNFEGRVNPLVKANYLASPPLVVAYAIAGRMDIDITNEPLGVSDDGEEITLKDIWPSSAEVADLMRSSVNRDAFTSKYSDVFAGNERWQAVQAPEGKTYTWDMSSTYVQNPPFFDGLGDEPSVEPIENARILGLFGDSITTDHISPAGSIKTDGPAGVYLAEHQVGVKDFNSYGARRGNHQVMMRGTFANIRIKNEMAPGTEGGVTIHQPSGETMSIYDAAMRYADEGTKLVVIAGKEYGTGSSRDWAAKGTRLLGVKAVIAESFERIHRSNLVGMGVLPLQFEKGTSRASLGLDGSEIVTILGLDEEITPRQNMQVKIQHADGRGEFITVLCRIDTENEIDYYRNGGILSYVLRGLIDGPQAAE